MVCRRDHREFRYRDPLWSSGHPGACGNVAEGRNVSAWPAPGRRTTRRACAAHGLCPERRRFHCPANSERIDWARARRRCGPESNSFLIRCRDDHTGRAGYCVFRRCDFCQVGRIDGSAYRLYHVMEPVRRASHSYLRDSIAGAVIFAAAGRLGGGHAGACRVDGIGLGRTGRRERKRGRI